MTKQVQKWVGNPPQSWLTYLANGSAFALTMPFRQMKTLQKFASVHVSLHNHFNQERHLTDRQTYKERRSTAFAEWSNIAA